MAKKALMMGNEALARGAWEAGCTVSTAYPGTPATEINEFMSRYEDVNTEWSANEKVALEVGIGSALAGARTLVSMKHVGINVAADPLFSVVYAGVNAGLVIVTADEPGLHSSQNEQDNRMYAKFAEVPMFEPSDAEEAREMVKRAFEVSEEFDTPVFIRMTTRICHTKSVVELGERQEVPTREYKKDPKKNAMIPAYAYDRHYVLEARNDRLAEMVEKAPENRIEMRDKRWGVITSGISYQNVREAMPECSVLKIGLTYPLPEQMIRDFAEQVDELYVIEENRPFLEEAVKVLGVKVEGKERILGVGELSATILKDRIRHQKSPQKAAAENVPARPPQFCPGCGHRGIFHILRKLKAVVHGDIGCYTLGVLPPFTSIDSCVCMGASVTMNHGFTKVEKIGETDKPSVAVIGDSTFFHSGLTGLASSVFNRSTGTVIVLDNRITGMTGHQPNPSTGKNLGGIECPRLDVADIAKAMGVKNVREIDAFDLKTCEEVIKEEINRPELSVIVANERCIMIEKTKYAAPYAVTEDCKNCKVCLKVGCPAITMVDGKVQILDYMCDGCGVCSQVCPFDAIKQKEAK